MVKVQVWALLVSALSAITCSTDALISAPAQVCVHEGDNAPAWTSFLSNATMTVSQPFPKTSRFNHNFAAQCPNNAAARVNVFALHRTSMCPWSYVVDFDYSRIPIQMMYARCSCGQCAARRGVCRPLHQSSHVIRKVCEKGVYKYRSAFESLPVACVCSYRNVVDINKRALG